MNTLKYKLNEIVEALGRAIPAITSVALFGSRRYKTGSLRSDVDLLVFTNGYVRPVDLRTFALDRYPFLDLFLVTGARAVSVMNESFVDAANPQALLTKLDAIPIWERSAGLLRAEVDWECEVAEGVAFIATLLPNTLSEEVIRGFLERIEARDLPVRPYLGESVDAVAEFLLKVVRRMLFRREDLGKKGAAKDGWTVDLQSEYDFQNLFFTVIKPWLPELGREEITIVYDGQSKSADFNLFGSQIIVEMKHVKDGNTKAAVVKTLKGLEDFYKNHSNVRVLLFCILVEQNVELDDARWEADFSYAAKTPKVLTTVIRNPAI